MGATFEADVIRELEQLSIEVASLGRAVRGAPGEGNVGIHAKIDTLTARHVAQYVEVDRRLDKQEVAFVRLRVWASTSAAAGGAIGATLAVILDLRRLFGGF